MDWRTLLGLAAAAALAAAAVLAEVRANERVIEHVDAAATA